MATEKKADVEKEVTAAPAAAGESKDPAAKKAVAKLYVTTEKVRSGRLRDPAANQMFTHNAPVEAVLREGNWLDAQVKAGLIKEFKS